MLDRCRCVLVRLGFGLLVSAAAAMTVPAATGGEVVLASDGKAKFPIVVSDTATEAVKKHASELAAMLERISSAPFEVGDGDGRQGIAVGKAADFPLAPVEGRLDSADALRGDEYILRTHPGGVWLVGATDVAVGHAVWDFLYRLGYRQYFPGSTWEIVPEHKKLEAAMDVFAAPSYVTRSIWHQWGTYNTAEFAAWRVRNRIASHFVLENGHMSQTVEWTNKQAFADHPEYYALVKGKRTPGDKLCISNPGLRKLFAEEIIRRFERNPQAASMSIEPSDGDGWCECEACKDMGSISDRQVILANETAKAVEAKFGTNKYLGMLAYFKHSAAPSIKVHPRVIVTAATHFGAAPAEETLAAWRQQDATLGVYEYFSVSTWHRDLPGLGAAAGLGFIPKTLPAWHHMGARFFSAESGENWGPYGLGYFLASRLLWDVKEATSVQSLRSEFLRLCFKKAAEPMDKFYSLIDGVNRDIQLEDLVGRMYRLLESARLADPDPAVQSRIDALIAYTRYVELYRSYERLKKAKASRQKEFEDLLFHAFRIRESGMVHTVALAQDLPGWDKEMAAPAAAKISGSKAVELWQNSAPPLTRDEITAVLNGGIAGNPTLSFEAVPFSRDLVPAGQRLKLPSVQPGNYRLHGEPSWYSWIDEGARGLTVSGAGQFTYKLYGIDTTLGEVLVSEASVSIPPYEGKRYRPKEFELTSPRSGLHRVTVRGNDSWELQQVSGHNGCRHVLPAKTPHNISPSMYFYVPKGTRVVAGETLSAAGVLRDGAGEVALEFSTLGDVSARQKSGTPYFIVSVQDKQDGSLWKIEGLTPGTYCMLYTVPPYYARSAEELLLPKEVVERDAAN